MKRVISAVSFLTAISISIFAFSSSSTIPQATILNDLCVQCGACIDACPREAIKEGDPYTINYELCDGCGECMDVCPEGAIWMVEVEYAR